MNAENKNFSCTYPNVKLKKEWIINEITPETIQWCESFGKYLALAENKKQDSQDKKAHSRQHGERTTQGMQDNGKKPLSSSQLRKFFGALKKIQNTEEYNPKRYPELLRLKTLLAYAVGRDKKEIGRDKKEKGNTTKIDDFYHEISAAIDALQGQGVKAFNNFVQIVEAIVAYHKVAGGE